MAKKFKTRYQDKGYTRRKLSPPKVWRGRGRKPKPVTEPTVYMRSPTTVASKLHKLDVIWSCWLMKELRLVSENPWAGVSVPRTDKVTPRYLKPEEIVAFFAWLSARWQGWRLPQLFFEVKAFLGNRISQLCSLRSDQLDSGRVVFPADEAKGRKERKAILPPKVYQELKEFAGPTYL